MFGRTTPPAFEFEGRTLDFKVPRIMGVINATPDSFFDGSRIGQAQQAAETALKMVADGADILDIGGQSTRPGAETVGIQTECDRILPAIEEVRSVLPDHPISVDTFHAEVASRALDAGADLVNDIGAGVLDPAMEDLVAERNVPYILMHMQGRPDTMQNRPSYENVTGRSVGIPRATRGCLEAKRSTAAWGRSWVRVWKKCGRTIINCSTPCINCPPSVFLYWPALAASL